MEKKVIEEMGKKIAILAGVVMFLLILGSLLPLLMPLFGYNAYIVISRSMEKNEKYFYPLWEHMGYNRSEADKKLPFSEGLYVGDVVVSKESNDYSIGDVVIHRKEKEDIGVHRLIMYNKTHFSLTEDATYTSERALKHMVPDYPSSLLEGKVIFKFPRAGILYIIIDCIRLPQRCRLFRESYE